MQQKEKNFVSCIIYLHNNEAQVQEFLETITQTMDKHFEKFELLCVNDGCIDGTVDKVKSFAAAQEKRVVISLVNLSYYQGIEHAMNAGVDLAVGDFIFEFDKCQLDFTEELIMQVYNRCMEGYDVVSAAPVNGIRFSSRVFYHIYNASNRGRGKLRQERFRIVSRRVINRVNQLNIYVPYRKAMYTNSGLKTDIITYKNKPVANGKGKNTGELDARNGLALDTLIIFTDFFERLSMIVSGILFAFLLVIFGWIIYSIFSADRPVEGWISLMALMSFGFFMLSLMLAVIFKYLSVLLNISFRKQRYVVEGVETLLK